MEFYKEEKLNEATGGAAVTATARAGAELAYQKRVETLLLDENCFKACVVSTLQFELRIGDRSEETLMRSLISS